MYIPLLIATALTLLVMIAMVTDIVSYRIPNWVNAALLLLYPIAYLALPSGAFSWTNALLGFGIVFVIGYIIFSLRIMGGGDIKMLAALGLWIGFSRPLLDFFLLVAIFGGVLTVALLSLRKIAPYIMIKLRGDDATIPQVLSYNEPLPYGVAIGLAFLWMMWRGAFPFFGQA
jgi:prepilin peptidase CpaA